MSKVHISINEIIGIENLSRAHEETLRHASEISAFVKERTIGPDKDECPETTVKENLKVSPQKFENKDDSLQKQSNISPVVNMPSPQNFDFQMMNASIITRANEQNRKRLIQQEMNEMQEKYLNMMRQSAEKERQHKEQQMKHIISEKKRSEAQILKEAEHRTATQMKECERQMEELRLQEKRKLKMNCFQGIAQYQSVFRIRYEGVVKLLMSIDKLALFSCTEYNRQLKEFIEKFDQLITKIKAGDCGFTELKQADGLCVSLKELQLTIQTDLENYTKKQQRALEEKQQEDQKAAVAASLAAAAVAESNTEKPAATPITTIPQQVANVTVPRAEVPTPALSEATTVAPSSTAVMSVVDGGPSMALYNQIHSFYQEKVDSVKPLQSDENMKKYRFACQKAINIPVNAISAVTPQHLQDKFEKIFNFLSGQPLKTAEGQISTNDHPLGHSYCLLLTAKKFVNQGETAISSNPQAAFPVASVVVSLWRLIPDFGKLFLAYVFKESPFLVPKRSQTGEEYRDLKRQAGITRLYAAVMVTCGRQAEGPSHPYGAENAWRWLVVFTSLDPLPDISATLILEMLQIVGASLWEVYGKQFAKLLLYIQREYYPRLSAVDEGGPKARLEMLLLNYLNQRQIPKPQGMLPPSFW